MEVCKISKLNEAVAYSIGFYHSTMDTAGRSALIDSFQEFLERLSQEIEKDQLESLIFSLDEDIPAGILETCTTPRKLFRCMKQRGLLGKNNWDILDHILKVAGRVDLCDRIKNFKDHSGMEVDSGFPGNCINFWLCAHGMGILTNVD